ncbi:MAG: PEP/pyruvate-binding domain-containing protein [Planctomycetota bacterium]|nr:PEP/pyruvate-binding domain-containing protein [Planctomycetota bacterium]
MPSSLQAQRASLGNGSKPAVASLASFVRVEDCASRAQSILYATIALTLLLPGPAHAIPSPDVMVNLFASAAQVLGLLSIVFGRWFFVSRRKSSASGKQSPVQKFAFAASVVLCLVASSGWYLYYASVRDDNLARLQVNLNRNSREEGRKIVDVSLKELSFSDQQRRDDGIQTEELARELAAPGDVQLIDVRESEEFEVGAIEKARHVRFPDLLAAPEKYLDKQRPITVLCFNGNRSSELAAHFENLGYQCRFMIGGYEKWLAEERALATSADGERGDLREVPDYANKMELLDTPDVMAVLEKREIQFVDVRYPGDFEAGHLPGAVNIPMRKLTTAELDAAILALPKDRAIIVPCYDKRSSFFGLVMGLRATRAGFEYLGRYTVPEGFSAPGKDKPHVAAWKAAHAPKSVLTIMSEPLSGILAWLQGHIGTLALAILALVALIRFAILPLTWKSERDRRVQRELEPESARLKVEAQGDGRLYAALSTELFRAHGVRPVLNFVATLAQLFFFTAFFSVVQRAAEGSVESFSWISELGKPDPTHILPLSVGALLVLQVLVTAKRPYKYWVLGLTVVAAAGLVALTWSLSAAVGLYLVASLTWLVAQTLAIGWFMNRRAGAPERERARVLARHEHANVVPLAVAHIVSGCGNKASRLARLMEAGFEVPNGFVVRASAVRARGADGRFAAEDANAVVEALRRMSATRLAVRSSGLNEDGADKSYAGVFDSILDVEKDSVFAALERVADSLSTDRTAAYSSERETGAIVVQAMVPARFAGVLFTEHPAHSGAAAVEWIAGLGDALVSGRAQPKSFALGRYSGLALTEESAPMDLGPLFAIGRHAEAVFGRPQDMEWAFADGRFFVLQARDITRLCTVGDDERALKEAERARLSSLARDELATTVVLAQNELTELLPRPRPFSLAFMNDLFGFGGSTHRAMQNLGLDYDVRPNSTPYVVSAFGALYVNKAEERRRLARGPSTIAAFRLTRAADEIERAWREEFDPAQRRDARRNEALDLTRFTLAELVDTFGEARRDFVERTYVRAEEINIGADFYMKAALRAIEKRHIDAASELSQIPPTVVHTAFERLARGDTFGFVEMFGHRAQLDYEFAEPRYVEDPDLVESLADRLSTARHAQRAKESAPVAHGGVLGLAIDRARRWQVLKEEAKHNALRDVAHLRRLLVELGSRTHLDERIFDLLPLEVARLSEDEFRTMTAPALVMRRADEAAAFESIRLPSALSLADLEALDLEHGGLIPRVPREGSLRGTRVSGTGGVIGRARVLREPHEIASFARHEILVARFTDPTWMPVFPLASGIVTEVGGWLSHAAIQAREYGLTGIVGVEGALASIETGDLLVLASDGTVEKIAERRVEVRITIERSVRVMRKSGEAEGRIRDLSTRGALLSIASTKLEIGEELDIETPWGEPLGARVVRNGIPGVYGLTLRETIDPATVVASTTK